MKVRETFTEEGESKPISLLALPGIQREELTKWIQTKGGLTVDEDFKIHYSVYSMWYDEFF